VFESVVETHDPHQTPSAAARRVEDVSLAADLGEQDGVEVRLQRAAYLPEDVTSVYLLQSSSADAVRDATTRVGPSILARGFQAASGLSTVILCTGHEVAPVAVELR
jgi:hypothetical protein